MYTYIHNDIHKYLCVYIYIHTYTHTQVDKLRVALARQNEDAGMSGVGEDDRARQALWLLRLNKDLAGAMQQLRALAESEVCVCVCVCIHTCMHVNQATS